MSGAVGSGWTAAKISSQAGRRALITGANSGIGYHTALELARKGAHVLMACRDKARGEEALARLRNEVPDASAEVVLLDLASLESVFAYGAAELGTGLPLDLLINNAGVMAPKQWTKTKDGFEVQFGTNVLGHFVLAAVLLPSLVRAAVANKEQRPRIVTLASIAHKRGSVNFNDLQSTRDYRPMEAYAQSKLADLMIALELNHKLRAADAPICEVMSVAAHPGVANTNLFQVGEFSAAERVARRTMGVAIGALLNSEAEGALPTLFAATSPDAVDGGYYGPQGFREMRGGDVGVAEIAEQALDRMAAAHLWSECERLTGVSLF